MVILSGGTRTRVRDEKLECHGSICANVRPLRAKGKGFVTRKRRRCKQRVYIAKMHGQYLAITAIDEVLRICHRYDVKYRWRNLPRTLSSYPELFC